MIESRASLSGMDQRIELLTVDQTVDEAGGVASVNTAFPTSRQLWGAVQRQQGSEQVEGDKPTAMAKARIETRFVEHVNKDMTVLWQAIEWQVVDLDPQPRHDRLIIFVERRGSSGDGDPR